jgi:hypothetical protein
MLQLLLNLWFQKWEKFQILRYLIKIQKKLGLNEELKRILKESSNWKPGTKDGKPAYLYFVLPVSIQIQASKK